MKNNKDQIKSVVVLVAICAVMAVLMAFVNGLTAPIIAENEAAAANEALLEVLPDGKNFFEVDLTEYTLPSTVEAAYGEDGGGYVFKLNTTGFSSGLVIMCGVDASGTVTGALCLASNETLGAEKTYGEKLVGVTGETVDTVDTVSTMTKTTSAYRAAVKDAINASVILGGGEVDIRTEEEILRDNLAEALPGADGKFSPVFITVAADSVDALYVADNGAGYVAVCGERFVAADADGNIISDCADELRGDVEAVISAASAQSDKIELSEYENIPGTVVEAYRTANGDYDITVKAAGYGINGDEYTASGEYIIVRVAVTADGKIINCVTVSQQETDGIGSACADREFYSQFSGRVEDDYRDIDAISGATYTTKGYVTAVGKVFETVRILEGVESNEE